MRLGRDNKTYFCPRKADDGVSYCTQKVVAAPAAAPPAVAAPAVASRAAMGPKGLLMLASLEFAARVFQGTGQGDDAIALANEVYRLNNMEDLS
jgi:hypothetical protein